MKIVYWISLVLITCLFSGCSILSPVQTESSNKYVINTVPPVKTKKSGHAITLFVATPATASFYDTNLMAYSTHALQRAYFAKNTWAANPADMLQPLMMQSLQNTHHFHAVISPSTGGQYDFILNTQIEQLIQDYASGHAFLRLTVRAEIIRARNNKIVATKQFVIIVPIFQKTPYGGVLAANQATGKFLQQLALFCLKYT